MLTPRQIEAFSKNGFLAPIPIMDKGKTEYYRSCFDALEAIEGREKTRIGLLDRHFDVPFIQAIATNPRILDAVTELIGPNILLLATHFFCKYGQEEKFVAWHQDVTYWGLNPPLALTVWYAVDDSDCENGCMRVIPKTHLGGIRDHQKSAIGGNLLSINQEIRVTESEESGAVDLPLRAGEVSFHDGLLIHGSLPNRSNRRRCGLTLRYVPTYVQQTTDNSVGRRWNATLVRGEDKFGQFSTVVPSL